MDSKIVVDELAKLISLQVSYQTKNSIDVRVDDIAKQKAKVAHALDGWIVGGTI